jgi:hypothetical protein
MKIELNTLLNSLTAPGVEIIVVVATASPLIARAKESGATVASAGSAMFPPKETLKRARH